MITHTMLERFTDAARTVMMVANREAERCRHEYVFPAHMVAGVLADDEMTNMLNGVGADVPLVRSKLEPHLTSADRNGPRAKAVVERTIAEARQRGHSQIGVEHIAMALLADPNGVLHEVLTNAGVDVEAFQERLTEALDRYPVSSLPDRASLLQMHQQFQSLFARLDDLQRRKEEAIRQQDFAAATKLRDETDRLKAEIEEACNHLRDA